MKKHSMSVSFLEGDLTSRHPLQVPEICGVDLFCGVGGLTRGLEEAGVDVRLGVDIDPACEFPYTSNNRASFRLQSVEDISGTELREALEGGQYSLLAGCAPCQPFSTYSQRWSTQSDGRWHLLQHFARLVREVQPDIVTMENVPRLRHEAIFKEFLKALESEGFHVSHEVVNSADYSVPQQRRRLVLVASRLGPIELMAPVSPQGRRITVRAAIGDLPRIEAGEASDLDRLHWAASLSPTNLKRIMASRPGGTWRDWDEDLRTNCHRRPTGKTYPGVYGRMEWDVPAPTVTTQYFGYGNGRFGHPEQNRGISLREGALLQSFPGDYKFVPEAEQIHKTTIGRLVGNAVPVELAKAIGTSIVRHVASSE